MSTILSRALGWAKSSDPNSEASPLRVVFLAVALLGLLGAAFSLTRTRGGALDPSDVLGPLYQRPMPQPPGFGPPSAIELPTGEKVTTFRASPDAGAEGGPSELVLMEFPVSRAESVLKDQFQALRFDSGKPKWGGGGRGGRGGRDGRGGGPGDSEDDSKKPKLQDAGTFLWHGYDATYARLRYGEGSLEDTKPFYDVIRVNLSVNGHCVIGYLRFPEREPGARDSAMAILAKFRPLV